MFRGLTIYQLTSPVSSVLERLLPALESNQYAPPGKSTARTCGFIQPLGPSTEALSYEAAGGVLFCLRTDEKLLPPAAVKELLNAKAAELENDAGWEGNKTDLRLLKEEIIEGLLPHTLPSPSWKYGYIDKELGLLLVGASDEDADAFIKSVGNALVGLPFLLLGTERDPCDMFTEWLREPSKLGEGFSLGDSCSLKHAQEGGTAVIQVQHDDLESEELAAMLDAGKQCCRIALEHAYMTLAVTAKLGIRAISLDDSAKADTEDDSASLARANDFAAFVPCMREVLRELEVILGGWPEQQLLDFGGVTTGAERETMMGQVKALEAMIGDDA